jgi:hypothetical protein
LGEYFLSYDLIASADNSLANLGEFKPVLINRTTSIPVYTYSADGKTFMKRYSSLRECVKESLLPSLMPKSENIAVYNLDRRSVTLCGSMGEVAKLLNTSLNTVRNHIRSGKPYKGNYLTRDSRYFG